MNKLLKKPRNDKLYEAILSLQTMEECKQFLEDLCSISELMAMEQRYHQPGEPLSAVRQGRIRAGVRTDGGEG